MVITTSAPAQAWATDAAAVPPAALSLSSEAATTSKPATDCPALRGCCATAIPIWPSPRKPIRAILFPACLVDFQSAFAGDQPVVMASGRRLTAVAPARPGWGEQDRPRSPSPPALR